jgi:hypothetical protein
MTTETVTPHRSPATPERDSFWYLVHAEWTKFRTVRGCPPAWTPRPRSG